MAHSKLHADEHTDGTDDIQNANSGQKGLMTSTYASKLDGIDNGADVTADNPPQAHALGGSRHNQDTLANLNSKISDATLVDSTDISNEITTAVATHVGLSDPHSQYQKESEKGAANGYASLDAGGKVPTSELPSSVTSGVVYQGTWDANANTPTIVSSTGDQGHYYVVSTAGSTNINGITDWKIGDWIIFNGSAWEKVDNTESVTSVFGRTGAVVAASNDYTHAQLASVGANDHHNEDHASRHSDGGADEIQVEDLAMTGTSGDFLESDGSGGISVVKKYWSQASPPVLSAGQWGVWEDTSSGTTYFIAYGNGGTRLVELTP